MVRCCPLIGCHLLCTILDCLNTRVSGDLRIANLQRQLGCCSTIPDRVSDSNSLFVLVCVHEDNDAAAPLWLVDSKPHEPSHWLLPPSPSPSLSPHCVVLGRRLRGWQLEDQLRPGEEEVCPAGNILGQTRGGDQQQEHAVSINSDYHELIRLEGNEKWRPTVSCARFCISPAAIDLLSPQKLVCYRFQLTLDYAQLMFLASFIMINRIQLEWPNGI